MHLEYELCLNDVLAASMRLVERSVTIRRRRRKSQIMSAVVIATLVIGFSILIGGAAGLLVGAPIAVGVVAMIWVLIPRYDTYQRRQVLREYYGGSDGMSALGSRRIEISDAGINVTSPDEESLHRWSAVTGVVVANDRFFIDLFGAELVVPLRAFSEHTQQDLLHNLERYLDNRESGLEARH